MVFIILRLLCLDVGFCELMTRTVGRVHNTAVGSITSLMWSVSLYEILLYCLVAFFVYLAIVAIVQLCGKNFMRALSTLLSIIIITLSFASVYAFTAGFAYNRAPLFMPMISQQTTLAEARSYASRHIDELRTLSDKMTYENSGYVVSPYTISELNEIIKSEYEKLKSTSFGDYFSSFTPTVKQIVSGNIMSSMHLTGVAFSPFAEANINSLTPTRYMPVVMAHEIAHIKGVMREDDANLVAYYICLSSDNDYLRYCGLAYTLYSSLNAAYSKNDDYYSTLTDSVPSAVYTENRAISDFWSDNSFLSDIMDWFNNLYLRFNGTGGTSDYSDPGSITDSDPSLPPENTVVYLSRVQRLIFGLI